MLALFQAIIEHFKALLEGTHSTQWCPLIRGKGLGYKAIDADNELTLGAHSIHLRTHPQNHLDGLGDILIRFSRQTNHVVQLDMAHALGCRQGNSAIYMLFRDALINRSAQPRAARLRCHRHGPQPAGGQGLCDLLRQHIRPHAGHTKWNAVLA